MSAFINFRRAQGFSLIELMVSLVIGMLALVFATRLMLVSEQNKDVSLGGSDAMQNGLQAMLTMKNDLEQAGFGLNDPIINGCDTLFRDANGFELATAARGVTPITPLTAVVISSNGAASDEISMYAGGSQSGTGSLGVSSDTGGGGTPMIDRLPYGFALGDVVVMANSEDRDGRCVVSQITDNPNDQPAPPAPPRILMDDPARFNHADTAAVTFDALKARIFNLGSADDLSLRTWSVNNGFLRLRASNLAGASLDPATVADNIVSIKAQYGFDTRAAALFNPTIGVQRTGMRIAQWSATMIDADGDSVVGGQGDWARVAAVRLAIVARGRNIEKPVGAAECKWTTAPLVVFDTQEPAHVTKEPMTLDLAVAGDTVDWKCYRYRKFETIVPIRNAGWRPTATRP